MYASDAIDILRAFYPQESTTGSAQRKKKPNSDGASTEWWNANNSAHGTVQDRDKRYLAAYAEIAKRAGKRIYATGIPLDDDFLWLDRAVIATLLKHGCIEMKSEAFELTTLGQELLDSVPIPASLR